MSNQSTGRPSSSTRLSTRCPCVGGRSSCVCSLWLISSWSEWSWSPVWVWAPWRGSTRCWGCGVSAPLRAWMTSSRPCTTWIYPAVPSCCRKEWKSCSGGLNWSKVSQPAEVTPTMASMGQCRTPEDTRTILSETSLLQLWRPVPGRDVTCWKLHLCHKWLILSNADV